jgi:hypothetical protein
MGFMDKAKKLAEQAQEKLDEAQKNFNRSDSPESQPQGETVKYDEHGRPIQDAPPAGATAPPAAEPTQEEPAAEPTQEQPAAEPTQEEPAADAPPPPPKPAAGDANASPDPFKPIQ